MMRFDYVHSARPLFLSRVLEAQIPQRLRPSLFALAVCVVFICALWAIDSYRLRQALYVQSQNASGYERAQMLLKETSVYYDRARSLVAIDREVQDIAASGDYTARTLAAIGNSFPPHAWLTAISADGTGLALDGRAQSLSALGALVRGLNRDNDLLNPRLVSAVADDEYGGSGGIKYQIHVDRRTQ